MLLDKKGGNPTTYWKGFPLEGIKASRKLTQKDESRCDGSHRSQKLAYSPARCSHAPRSGIQQKVRRTLPRASASVSGQPLCIWPFLKAVS